jgi:hypothetical protein
MAVPDRECVMAVPDRECVMAAPDRECVMAAPDRECNFIWFTQPLGLLFVYSLLN